MLLFCWFLYFPPAINGFVYGNLPTLDICLGRPVTWHLFGIGNDIDLHSIHFYGHTLLSQGHRTDVLSVFPATSVTAQMVPMTAGKWLFGCQVDDHVHGNLSCWCYSTVQMSPLISSYFAYKEPEFSCIFHVFFLYSLEE